MTTRAASKSEKSAYWHYLLHLIHLSVTNCFTDYVFVDFLFLAINSVRLSLRLNHIKFLTI